MIGRLSAQRLESEHLKAVNKSLRQSTGKRSLVKPPDLKYFHLNAKTKSARELCFALFCENFINIIRCIEWTRAKARITLFAGSDWGTSRVELQIAFHFLMILLTASDRQFAHRSTTLPARIRTKCVSCLLRHSLSNDSQRELCLLSESAVVLPMTFLSSRVMKVFGTRARTPPSYFRCLAWDVRRKSWANSLVRSFTSI